MLRTRVRTRGEFHWGIIAGRRICDSKGSCTSFYTRYCWVAASLLPGRHQTPLGGPVLLPLASGICSLDVTLMESQLPSQTSYGLIHVDLRGASPQSCLSLPPSLSDASGKRRYMDACVASPRRRASYGYGHRGYARSAHPSTAFTLRGS